MVAQACSIACIEGMSNPLGRIIMRIIVLQTSAQSVHIDAHLIMPSAIALSAHMVHACSQAEHASMQRCIVIMSMAGIPKVSIDIVCIISAVMFASIASPFSFGAVAVCVDGTVIRDATRTALPLPR